jgi:DNA-binding NarL/FixJ family response regulator
MTAPLQDPELVDLRDASVLALVVDSHAASRIGIGVLVHRQPWVSCCLLAADRDEAGQLAVRHKPDVGIFDVTEPGPLVCSYTAPLRAAHPTMPIVLSARCRAASAA